MANQNEGAMVCIMPFSTEFLAGIPVTIPGGARRDASVPLVRKFPQWWAREDRPSEIEAKRKAAWAEVYAVVPDQAPVATIETPMLKARRDVSLDLDGEHRVVKRGELLKINDPLGELLPDRFERVLVKSQ
jgi:hypothetical protein